MINPSVKVSRILHAGYLFQNENTSIAFDPIFENPFSKNCYAFPSVQFDHKIIRHISLSAVFISHHHDDHCSLESLALLDRKTPIYIYCQFEELLDWIRQLGFVHVTHLNLNEPVLIDSFTVTPLPALDQEVDCVFHIHIAGLNILNVVDSWLPEQTMKYLTTIPSWQMILWPFQMMREVEVLSPHRTKTPPPDYPEEWSEQLKALQPYFVVPSSCQFMHEKWSWYCKSFFSMSYKTFSLWINNILAKTKVVRLNPGDTVLLSQDSVSVEKPLAWIIPNGNQNLDYEFDPDAQPQSTAEIATHFPPINENQKKTVLDFCKNTIIERYKEIGPPQDIYFQKKRHWRLSVFDHQGDAHCFFYEIQDENMRQIDSVVNHLNWTTEVPISTLYGALALGEALSSMYIRINPDTFDALTEHELENVDLLEDPLVRTLFNGIFCSYQKAQLEKLLKTPNN